MLEETHLQLLPPASSESRTSAVPRGVYREERLNGARVFRLSLGRGSGLSAHRFVGWVVRRASVPFGDGTVMCSFMCVILNGREASERWYRVATTLTMSSRSTPADTDPRYQMAVASSSDGSGPGFHVVDWTLTDTRRSIIRVAVPTHCCSGQDGSCSRCFSEFSLKRR